MRDLARLLQCFRCLKKFPAAQFPICENGGRRKICPSCFTPPRQDKLCAKCRERKDKKFFSQTLSGALREVCEDCRVRRLDGPKRCSRCRKLQAYEDFNCWSNGAKKRHCKECDEKPVQTRVCTRCNVEKTKYEYPKYRNGATGRCCNECLKTIRKQHHKNLSEAPNPCVQCGKTYKLAMAQHKREMNKYCGQECRNAAKRVQFKECTGCLITKPYEEFTYKRGSRAKKLICIECEEKKKKGIFSRSQERLSIPSIVRYARAMARFNKQDFKLSLAEAHEMVEKGCGLCGQPGYTILPKSRSEAFYAANLYVCCAACRYMCKNRTYFEIVQWAIMVATGRGYVSADEKSERVKRSGRARKSERDSG